MLYGGIRPQWVKMAAADIFTYEYVFMSGKKNIGSADVLVIVDDIIVVLCLWVISWTRSWCLNNATCTKWLYMNGISTKMQTISCISFVFTQLSTNMINTRNYSSHWDLVMPICIIIVSGNGLLSENAFGNVVCIYLYMSLVKFHQ